MFRKKSELRICIMQFWEKKSEFLDVNSQLQEQKSIVK